jgi:hypothetical protein
MKDAIPLLKCPKLKPNETPQLTMIVYTTRKQPAKRRITSDILAKLLGDSCKAAKASAILSTPPAEEYVSPTSRQYKYTQKINRGSLAKNA